MNAPSFRDRPFGCPPDYALGRLPRGTMNKTEAAYAAHLEKLKWAKEIVFFEFEAIKLRLADNTFYNPDFLVISSNLVIQLHEVKGFMRDDANVKIKVAAAKYPHFQFILVRKVAKARGEWEFKSY